MSKASVSSCVQAHICIHFRLSIDPSMRGNRMQVTMPLWAYESCPYVLLYNNDTILLLQTYSFSKKFPTLKMSGNIALPATYALPHYAFLLSSRVPGSGAEYKDDDF